MEEFFACNREWVSSVPCVRRKNTGEGIGGNRTAEVSTVLPEMQDREGHRLRAAVSSEKREQNKLLASQYYN